MNLDSRRTGRTTKLVVSSLKELIVLGKTTFVDHRKDNGSEQSTANLVQIYNQIKECTTCLLNGYFPFQVRFNLKNKSAYIYDPTKWGEKGEAI